MRNFRDYDRTQRFLLPPDLSDWVADDDLAHFIVAAVERVDISAFHVSRTGSGKAQYHPRMMLALLIYCYASGIFSSRRIERATHRDVSVRFIAANSHPDHDTIAKFRRDNIRAFEVAFTQLLLLASEAGLLKVGTVSVDPYIGYLLRYANQLDGGWVMPMIAAWLVHLPRGFSSAPYRATDNQAIVISEGRVSVEMNGEAFDLGSNDVMALPGWTWPTMRASEDAVIFFFSDRSAQEKLGLWKEERGNI